MRHAAASHRASVERITEDRKRERDREKVRERESSRDTTDDAERFDMSLISTTYYEEF